MAILGGCLCGAVRYSIDELDGAMWNCFCDTCRRSHSADHNTAAKVKREHFHVVQGAARLVSYESSPGKLRWFCPVCGAHIYAERPAQPAAVVVRAGSFDADPGVRPAFSVWLSHAKPWLKYDQEKPSHPESAPG